MLSNRPIVINFSGNWVSAVTDVLMLILTLVSVICAYKAYQHQRNRSKKAAACELARYYAGEIIEKNSLIANVFNYSKLDNYIKETICLNDIKRFDRDELEELLKAKGIGLDEFLKKIYSVDPIVIFNVRIVRCCSAQERDLTVNDYIDIDETTGEKKLRNASLLCSDFFQEISDLLNQLEWFAMNCHYGLADEELLYQSLHQTFLSTVWVLYPFISNGNIGNEDKLYTNVIWLFDKWHARLAEIKEKAEKKKKELQRKADEVKPEVFSGRGI